MNRCFSVPNLSCPPPRRNPSQRWVRAALFLAGVGLLPAAQAAGVQVAELRAVIPAGRLGSTEPPAAPGPGSRRLGVQDGAASNGPSLYWLGDYRFAPSWGLRATGGLLGRLESAPPLGTPGAAFRLDPAVMPSDGLRATPYLGFGFDRSHSTSGGWGGWGLSADVGLVSRNWGPGAAMSAEPRSVRLGNSTTGDNWLRSLRLMPLVQVGVSYAF